MIGNAQEPRRLRLIPARILQGVGDQASAISLHFLVKAPALRGGLFIQDFRTDLSTLGDDLRKNLGQKRNPEKERIFIRADRDVLYGDFMGVMNMLQDNGFYSVALVGEDKK